jgi:hypothetical protein
MGVALRRLILVILLGAVLAVPGVAAATAAALPYNLVLSPRPTSSPSTGTIVGQFGGVPVAGAYRGNSASGTLTLTVKGPTFAEGTYSCADSGCAFTGAVAEKRVSAVTMSSLSGVGQATSSAFPNREAWVSAVSDWANTHLGADQLASIVSAAASVKMTQTLNEQGQGSGHGGESGGNGGAGGGNGGMGGGHGY